MHQVEVNVVKAQTLQGGIERRLDIFRVMGIVP